MKKFIAPFLIFFMTISISHAQAVKINKANISQEAQIAVPTKNHQQFLTIHKENESPFEIYQDLLNDEMVIRLKNQFDVLRFEIRDANGTTMNIKGRQDKNEVHADIQSLTNGRYQMIVNRNNQKIFTEFFLER